MRIAWGITGGGDKICDTLEIMKKINKLNEVSIEVFLSKAGLLVLKYYKIFENLKASFIKVWIEQDANIPFLTARLQMKEFDLLLIAPATSNTVAKVAVGISDTLLTNAIIQGVKGYIPVYVMPTDFREGNTITILPSGKTLKLRVRKEDAVNVEILQNMDGIEVFENPSQILDIIKSFQNI
jgi:archaeoflavoprotein AfpA